MYYESLLKDTPIALCNDCFNVFSALPSESIDLILCDLPYHITQNFWDIQIPLEDYILVGSRYITFSEFNRFLWDPGRKLWAQERTAFRKLFSQPLSEIKEYWNAYRQPGLWSHYKRVIKPHGAIVLFGCGMFTSELMRTGHDLWRYNIIWHKKHPTGFLNANRMPLRGHEDILVFYRKLPVYHPQKTTGHTRKVSTAKHKRNTKRTTTYGEYGFVSYDSTERFPTSVWCFGQDTQTEALHPTQKPLALCEEIIKTYTDEGAVVLDNCAGSFTVPVACDNLKRNWIAIEKERLFFDLGLTRVNANREVLGMSPVTENFSVYELCTNK